MNSTLTTPLRGKPRAWIVAVLLAIVLAGSALRFSGRYWDEGHGLHPDERFIMMVTSALRLPPEGVSWFDATRSPLNPNVNGANLFVYGTLPLYLVGTLQHFVGRRMGLDVYQTGRTVTAVFDTASLVLVAVLGLYLLGPLGSIFSTMAYAFAVVPIQLSHFYTVDPYAAFFCLATIALALLAAATRHRRTFRRAIIGAGVTLGCAAASKASSFPIALVIPLALWIRDRRTHEGPGMLPEDRNGRLQRLAVPTLVSLFVAFVVFRFAQPYAFLGPGVFGLRFNPRWLENMREIQRLSVPGVGFPPNVQWWARAPWFPIEQIAFWGLSPLVFLGALAGGAAVAWKNLRHDRWSALATLWVWSVVNFTLFGAMAGVKYLRYQLPIYGCACLLFGYAMTRLPYSALAGRVRERLGKPWRVPALSLGYGCAALTVAVLWAIAFTSIYRAPVTRVEASEWILRHWAGPINLVVRAATQETLLEPVPVRGGRLPDSLDIRAHSEGTVEEILVHRVRLPGGATTPTGERHLASLPSVENRVPFAVQIERYDAPPDGSAKSASFTGELVLRNGLGENLRLRTSERFAIRQGERLRLLFRSGSLSPDAQFEGTRIVHETGWDDTLPLRVEGWDPYGGLYPSDLKLDLYDPNLERVRDALLTADTISISSNRVYGTMTRMGRDFPLVDRFYRALLPCPKERSVAECYREATPEQTVSALGFRLEKTFTRNPTVAGLVIPDQAAEEAFTVYDHPRVLLFRKEVRLDAAAIERVLLTNYR